MTDATILSLRSIEYAHMLLAYPAQHHRNPLLQAETLTLVSKVLSSQRWKKRSSIQARGWCR